TTAVRAAAQQSDPARFDAEVAAARSRVGQAIRTVSDAVHQVHGALGFTHEHILHHFTRRTWAWRDEYGNESFWEERLGRHIASTAAANVWAFIATP
ncbi:MAG: acyl-CoA dehydrogenase family protein, partial [Pseudomonadota bacterium]